MGLAINMPVSKASPTPTANVLPHGIAHPPSEWNALQCIFAPFDPWLVGGAARSLYFNLHHVCKPKDWDVIIPEAYARAVETKMASLAEDVKNEIKNSKPYKFITINPFTPKHAATEGQDQPEVANMTKDAKDAMAPGWKCKLKHDFAAASLGDCFFNLDIWCDDIVSYLASIPSAYDGIAIRLRDKFIMVTHEFSMGRNFLVSNRPVTAVAVDAVFKAHLMRQGL